MAYNLIGCFCERDNIAFTNGLLLMESRLILPAALQKHMLNEIHTGRQGINKCRERAQCSVWWLGISKDMTFHDENYSVRKIDFLIQNLCCLA